MNRLNKTKREQGFTIIEVLIVLAIAGLIILIVFLAVPALQRNSRNTQYKEQASNYVAAVSEWMNNNNGSPPSTDAQVAEINALSADGPLAEPTSIVTGAQTGTPNIGVMELQPGLICDKGTIGNTVASSSRTIAVRYSIENSTGDPVKQCAGS